MSAFQFTRKSDYGLLILSTLAKQGQGKVVSLNTISRQRYLPRAFASQIGKKLVKAEIIGSKEGRSGGYYLKRSPQQIDLLSILQVIEGKVEPVLCAHRPGECKLEAVCLQRNFMMRLGKELKDLLRSYTLADLIQ